MARWAQFQSGSYEMGQSPGILGTPSAPSSMPRGRTSVPVAKSDKSVLTFWHFSHNLSRGSSTVVHLGGSKPSAHAHITRTH